jgi:hypothetical protein
MARLAAPDQDDAPLDGVSLPNGEAVGDDGKTSRRRCQDGIVLPAHWPVRWLRSRSSMREGSASALNQSASVNTASGVLAAKVRRYLDAGYRPVLGSLDASTTAFRLAPGERRLLPLRCEAGGQYAVVASSEGVDDPDLAVFDGDSKLVASDGSVTPAPEVRFRAGPAGVCYVVVQNSQDRDALVAVVRLRK